MILSILFLQKHYLYLSLEISFLKGLAVISFCFVVFLCQPFIKDNMKFISFIIPVIFLTRDGYHQKQIFVIF